MPVYEGAAFSLIHEEVESDEFYGKDGMGDVKTDFDKPLCLIEGEKAPHALVRIAKANESEIMIVLCLILNLYAELNVFVLFF